MTRSGEAFQSWPSSSVTVEYVVIGKEKADCMLRRMQSCMNTTVSTWK
jgi:hypothetical protein